MESGASGRPGVAVLHPVEVRLRGLRPGPGTVTHLHLGMGERIVRETTQTLSHAMDLLVLVSPT